MIYFPEIAFSANILHNKYYYWCRRH